jgi:hypothetical protein
VAQKALRATARYSAVKQRFLRAATKQMLRDIEPDEPGTADNRDVYRDDSSQELGAKILLWIAIGHEAPGWLRRFSAGPGEEATRAGER